MDFLDARRELLAEGDVEEAASAAGFRFFTPVEAFMNYIGTEIHEETA